MAGEQFTRDGHRGRRRIDAIGRGQPGWHTAAVTTTAAAALDDIPVGSELAARLTAMTVPYDAIDEVLALAARLDDPQREFIDRCRSAVLAALGSNAEMVALPSLAQVPGAEPGSLFARFGFVLMYAALLPATRRFHADLGVPTSITAATVADLGRNMLVFQKRFGVTGFDEQHWISLHFSGQLFQIGRLQFQLTTLGDRTAAGIAAAGLPVSADDPTLSIHLPRFCGSLTAASCEASLAAARQFVAERFPALELRVSVCKSWLLDPQLSEVLGAGSNIAAFQRRFTLAYPPEVDNESALRFVFANPDLPLSELPQQSSLQRAVVRVLAGGGDWHAGMGYFRWGD